ncbi:MAG TPA: GerMN domain-containing protein [Thermoanaerobaculia bacterium]|nr:GerMN domain-containing protein [Thermoanaerobaculia bacterium]
MSRRAAGLVLGAALLLLAAGLVWWGWSGRTRRPGGSASPTSGSAGPEVTFPVDLYFPADAVDRGLLRIERRTLTASEVPKDRIKKIVQALLAGPTAPPAGSHPAGLVRPLPPGVALGAVELTADGIAYLDLRWADHDDPPAGGSDAEMQTIYSLVDSIVFNVPQAQRVVLLWNGTQRLTFSGHLDTSHPLGPDRSLLAR